MTEREGRAVGRGREGVSTSLENLKLLSSEMNKNASRTTKRK